MSTNSRIADFICAEFAPELTPDQIPSDLDLIDSGLIDSLGVLKLVAFLENDLGLVIAAEDLDVDLYRNLDAITALVDGKRLAA